MTILFLAAVAIENLLKALLMNKHPEYVSGGAFKNELISSHDLERIARAAGVALDPEESDFCKLGTVALKSLGRYRLGKCAIKSFNGHGVNDHAFRVYGRLYKRLRQDVLALPTGKRREVPKGNT
jgi:hypothetical protein